jgi:hypothetical protein
MKIKLILTISLFAGILLSGCGDKKSGEETLTPPAGMRYLDISRTGMNLYVLTPDDKAGILDTVMQSWGGYEIKVGKEFQIAVEEGAGDIEMVKSDNAGNDVNKLKRYLVDEPTTLVWESGVADLSEFHFYHIIKIGNRSFVIQDIKGEPFSQKAIEKMLDAAKQTKEVKKGEASE